MLPTVNFELLEKKKRFWLLRKSNIISKSSSNATLAEIEVKFSPYAGCRSASKTDKYKYGL